MKTEVHRHNRNARAVLVGLVITCTVVCSLLSTAPLGAQPSTEGLRAKERSPRFELSVGSELFASTPNDAYERNVPANTRAAMVAARWSEEPFFGFQVAGWWLRRSYRARVYSGPGNETPRIQTDQLIAIGPIVDISWSISPSLQFGPAVGAGYVPWQSNSRPGYATKTGLLMAGVAARTRRVVVEVQALSPFDSNLPGVFPIMVGWRF